MNKNNQHARRDGRRLIKVVARTHAPCSANKYPMTFKNDWFFVWLIEQSRTLERKKKKAAEAKEAAELDLDAGKGGGAYGGAAVIPICLPVCCAMPCVIMWLAYPWPTTTTTTTTTCDIQSTFNRHSIATQRYVDRQSFRILASATTWQWTHDTRQPVNPRPAAILNTCLATFLKINQTKNNILKTE